METPQENKPAEVEEPEQKLMLQIFLTRQGQLLVNSVFLKDKILCYGLLELAKETIQDASKEKPRIVLAQNFMNGLRNMRGK